MPPCYIADLWACKMKGVKLFGIKLQTGQGLRKKIKAGREAPLTFCLPRVVAFRTKLTI